MLQNADTTSAFLCRRAASIVVDNRSSAYAVSLLYYPALASALTHVAPAVSSSISSAVSRI